MPEFISAKNKPVSITQIRIKSKTSSGKKHHFFFQVPEEIKPVLIFISQPHMFTCSCGIQIDKVNVPEIGDDPVIFVGFSYVPNISFESLVKIVSRIR